MPIHGIVPAVGLAAVIHLAALPHPVALLPVNQAHLADFSVRNRAGKRLIPRAAVQVQHAPQRRRAFAIRLLERGQRAHFRRHGLFRIHVNAALQAFDGNARRIREPRIDRGQLRRFLVQHAPPVVIGAAAAFLRQRAHVLRAAARRDGARRTGLAVSHGLQHLRVMPRISDNYILHPAFLTVPSAARRLPPRRPSSIPRHS